MQPQDKPLDKQQQTDGHQEKASTADRRSQAIRQAVLASVCLSVLLTPNFVWNALRGNVDLGLFAQEIGQRAQQFRSLFVGRPKPIQALRNAIIGQESGGNHTLLNASGSGAMGLGQVMPENIPQWSREALGKEISQTEFLNSPDLQLVIIDFKLQQYWDDAIKQAKGNEDEAVLRVASWWYSGNPDKFTDTKPQFWGGDAYPSIAEYSQSVLARFKRQQARLP